MAQVGRLTLLLVDDHRIFAEVLGMRLGHEDAVSEVAIAYCLDEARAMARRIQPDVVILDHEIGDEVGLDLIPDLRRLPRPPQVVMLSASDQARTIIDALDSGAAAWVVKGAQVDVLMLATHEVLAGRMYLYPATIRPVVETLLLGSRDGREPDFVDEVSERQLEVLRCLVAGMTRTETGNRLFITSNTVRTHVQHLLHAADVHSTLALVARARELGVTGIDDPMDRAQRSSR